MTNDYDIVSAQAGVTSIAAAVTQMKDSLAQAFEQMARVTRAAVRPLVQLSLAMRERANDPVHVAGLEARYYVRAGMDPAYATREDLSRLLGAIMDTDSEEAEGLWMMTAENRRLVAVSAMRGWSENRSEPGRPAQVCVHRQWGSTRVEVRCG